MEEASKYAEECTNDATVERAWATQAFKHAEAYMKLLSVATDLTTMRLTRYDDTLYNQFRELFPDLDVSTLNEDEMKSEEAKAIWRPFLMKWKNAIQEYNYGTLLRLDASKGYDQDNACIVPRTQFYCVEIARNRENVNRALSH